MTAECVRDGQPLAFPVFLYEEAFNVYLQGMDWQKDTTTREEREQMAMLVSS